MKGLFQRLRTGLARTRAGLGDSLARAGGGGVLTEDDAEALEAALLEADIGVATTERLLEALRAKGRPGAEPDWARDVLRAEVRTLLEATESPPAERTRPHVILVVGVNGTGKTTTVGKLAAHHARAGERVLVVAADTFRAAANEQLATWARRAGVDIVESKSGADPASVAFDGVLAARAREVGVVLVDTAGRLHAKVGLMEEVRKIHRVIGKALDGAPHEVFLVLDATTGQNGVAQARAFGEACPLTGVVLTKIDGTAKGGVVVAVAGALGVPVRYVGVGEGVDDLIAFEPAVFTEALFAAD